MLITVNWSTYAEVSYFEELDFINRKMVSKRGKTLY